MSPLEWAKYYAVEILRLCNIGLGINCGICADTGRVMCRWCSGSGGSFITCKWCGGTGETVCACQKGKKK